VNVVLPKGEEAGGLYIKWADHPVAIRIQVETNGKYETIAVCDTPYLCDYIPLPEGVTAFRFLQAEKARGRMYIAEMRVFSRGNPPDYVQRWNEPCQKADLLVISTHPDDELIFLGGTIPYYAGELGKAVQVAYVVPATPERRLELLDGLWHCGVRNYPMIGKFKDRFSTKLAVMQQSWGKKRLDDFIVRLYRQFRPDVVVSQDLKGEYGHGGHKAVADAAARAVVLAAKAGYDTDSVKSYGVWQVSKLYLHLYPENQVRMDWRVPLNAFGGKTAFDIASEAFGFHVSQQKGQYFVEDFGPYDNDIFGLYASTVGEDLAKNDFFENIK
jgi:LmbE family N-acetylglucosaminyl deacetylase